MFQAAAVRALTARLQAGMQNANEAAAADIDAMFQEQQQLTQRGSDLASGVGGMQV